MNRVAYPLVIILLLAGLAPIVSAEGAENEQGTYKKLLQTIDGAISSVRRGGSPGLGPAKDLYDNLVGSYENENFNNDSELIALHNRITDLFEQSTTEENIRTLRSDISRMASKIGIWLSPIYAYAMFIVLGIGVVVSLLVTLVSRRMVNWAQLREDKARISEFQKELREAQSRRDMKSIHKLQQRQSEILSIQKRVFSATFKPTIIYIIPLILLWFTLMNVYSGWVVAWLPFRIDIPIIAPNGLVAFGVGWWYFITYLGFSQIWRKILIRD